MLTDEVAPTLAKTPRSDVTSVIAKLEALPDRQFKQVEDKTPGARKDEVMTILKNA